ncbi:MAG: hypothetical protein EA412_07985 [Chitinophagaceae bacterium]|nr:MAG: hypothetical protein EA412_07985 [Chitinophagaceae bacterium]
MKLFLIACILSLFLANCKSGNHLHDNTDVMNEETQQPKILFVNFSLTQDSISGILSADLINYIVTKGRLKESAKSKRYAEDGDLAFLLLDTNGEPLKEIIFENPLQKKVEYVDNEGKLATKMLKLQETDHFLRLQLIEGSAAFIIQEFIKSPEQLRNDILKVNIE